MYQHPNKGIFAGIAAGCFWGTPFLAPMILSDFSSFEITFGRFLCFGLISLLSLTRIIKVIRDFSLAQIIHILILSSTGFWLYTLLLFSGVKLTNGMIAALIVGCLPLTMILFSKPQFNIFLVMGLSLIVVGMFCLLVIPILQDAHALADINAVGILLLFTALMTWTFFGIHNSYFMHSNQKIKSIDYSSLVGVINLIIVVPAFFIIDGGKNLLHHEEWSNYIIWSMILGIGASWIANILWAYSAKNCPPSIGGSLIISETIFGVLYSLFYIQRLPYPNELIAILCLICGVILSIRSQL